MKKLKLLIVLLTVSQLSCQNIDKEKEVIKNVIQTAYVEGLQNEGNIQKIDSGIHPDFNLLGMGKGNSIWKYSIKDWKAKAIQKKDNGELPLSGNKKVTVDFKSIDITGTAAMAKIEFYIGSKLTYIDYISLYKFNNGWKMVNKIFYKL